MRGIAVGIIGREEERTRLRVDKEGAVF